MKSLKERWKSESQQMVPDSTPAEGETKKSADFAIYKTDEDKRLVFGWASVVVTVDGEELEDRQHDMIDPEDLEEAAYEYVLNFRDTGEEHLPGYRKKGKLVESCVFTAEKQKAMGIPEGILPVAWWIGFYIEDDDTWQRVKNGTYKMFSIEGRAQREEVRKAESTAVTFDEVLKFNPYHGYHGYFSTANAATSMTIRTSSAAGQKAIANIKAKELAAQGGGSVSSNPSSSAESKSKKTKEAYGSTKKQKDHKEESYLDDDDFPDDNTYEMVAQDLGVSQKKAKAMVDSVFAYSGPDSSEIREAARGESDIRKKDADNIEDFIKNSSKWTGELHRGIEIDDDVLQEMMLATYMKKPIDMGGPSSWSSKNKIAEDFSKSYTGKNSVIFHVKNSGGKGTSIKHLSAHQREDEVLVSSTATFTPNKAEVDANGVTHIYGKLS